MQHFFIYLFRGHSTMSFQNEYTLVRLPPNDFEVLWHLVKLCICDIPKKRDFFRSCQHCGSVQVLQQLRRYQHSTSTKYQTDKPQDNFSGKDNAEENKDIFGNNYIHTFETRPLIVIKSNDSKQSQRPIF